MINTRISLTLFLTILIGLGLIYTEATDADLSAGLSAVGNSLNATTLEFSNRDTANDAKSSLLFNTFGLIPNGFDIKAIRVKKDGHEYFKYHLSAQKTAGDDILCNELKLEVWHNRQSEYNGKLLDFNANSAIDDQNKDDWIFFVSLLNDDKNISVKFCEFDFEFKTYRNNPGENGGFSDRELLKSRITSGSW